MVTGSPQVKIWSLASGFCFVTFADHAAPVTALAWLPSGNAVLSASLDGTVCSCHTLSQYPPDFCPPTITTLLQAFGLQHGTLHTSALPSEMGEEASNDCVPQLAALSQAVHVSKYYLMPPTWLCSGL